MLVEYVRLRKSVTDFAIATLTKSWLICNVSQLRDIGVRDLLTLDLASPDMQTWDGNMEIFP